MAQFAYSGLVGECICGILAVKCDGYAHKCKDYEVSRQLVIMGSGETSPTMVTPHQKILAEVSKATGAAVFLDTPFGFQENADILAGKISDYFKSSVGRDIAAVTMRSDSESAATVARAVSAINQAQWLFAGPGSPTYALSAWRNSGLAEHISAVLARGSAVFASAAALTIGSQTVPVYEIYKVGMEPHWLPGLNILGEHTGLQAAVIPHFDNSEGGNHDTRFCYLGQTRLTQLEQQLPADTFILGIDEHTGINFDLDAKSLSVFGRGVLTLRKGEMLKTFAAGSTLTWDEVAEAVAVSRPTIAVAPVEVSDAARIAQLLSGGNFNEAVAGLLEIDRLDRDEATRRKVHSLISQLGDLAATPSVDSSQIITPFVQALIALRQSARAAGRWDEADLIRVLLLEQNIVIKDAADHTDWEITS